MQPRLAILNSRFLCRSAMWLAGEQHSPTRKPARRGGSSLAATPAVRWSGEDSLHMLTDADGHLFLILPSKVQWVYGVIASVNGAEVQIIPLTSGPPAAPTDVTLTLGRVLGPQMKNDFIGLVDTTGVLKGRTITTISSSGSHTLALCSDGTLVAWGRNNFGQLGNGTDGADASTPNTRGWAISPVLVHRPGAFKDKKITSVVATADESFAICADGSLYVWGAWRRGLGGKIEYSDEPVLFNAGALKDRQVVAIAPSGIDSHNGGPNENCLALCADGSLVGWGNYFSLWERPISRSFADNNTYAEPFVVDTRGLLKGKTITSLTTWGVLCSDGTLGVWHIIPQTKTTPQFGQLYIMSMEGVLEGKKIKTIVNGVCPMALCDDDTLVAWIRPLDVSGRNANVAYKLYRDVESKTISPIYLRRDTQPTVISDTNLLTLKTVTAIAGPLI